MDVNMSPVKITFELINDLFNKLADNEPDIITKIINICRNMIFYDCYNNYVEEIKNCVIDNIIINIINRYNTHGELMDKILDGINDNLSYYQFYWHFIYRINLSQYNLSNNAMKTIIQKIMDNSVLPRMYESTYTIYATEILDELCAIYGDKIDNIFNNDLPIHKNMLINKEPIFNVLTTVGKLTVIGCTEVLHEVLLEAQLNEEYIGDLIKCAERYNNTECHKYLVNLLYNIKI